ncbi:MAG TPA: ABC transporter substrate-binding protein, partial [Leptospiraceae bacterium]|nr:ABC transporter substrate-binding protein [Leptospiraceae bacterium]
MQKDTVRIGLMAPLSGIVQLYGREICTAAQIACDEINQNGGVLGKRLELIILDDGSLPETAVPAAVRLIDEFKCSALIGNLLSNSRIAVSALVSEPRRIPFLNFSFYEGSITGRYFFHFAALPNQQIGNMIPYMADTFG